MFLAPPKPSPTQLEFRRAEHPGFRIRRKECGCTLGKLALRRQSRSNAQGKVAGTPAVMQPNHVTASLTPTLAVVHCAARGPANKKSRHTAAFQATRLKIIVQALKDRVNIVNQAPPRRIYRKLGPWLLSKCRAVAVGPAPPRGVERFRGRLPSVREMLEDSYFEAPCAQRPSYPGLLLSLN